MEWDEPKRPATRDITVGEPLATLSIAELEARVAALTGEIMTLQAEGSYDKAKAMIDTLGTIRPQTKAVLDRLTDVPVDIEPRFTTAIELLK